MTRRYWAEDELQFLRDNHIAMTRRELGRRLGRTHLGVRMKLQELRLVKLPRLNLPPALPGFKVCAKCRKAQPVSEFHRDKYRPDGLTARCYGCVAEHMKVWNNRASRREELVLRKFGLTVADYIAMLDKQDGVCAICKTFPTTHPRSLCVDHDHVTGRIRGLLCMKCNTALGTLGDSVQGLRRAMDYLEGVTSGN